MDAVTIDTCFSVLFFIITVTMLLVSHFYGHPFRSRRFSPDEHTCGGGTAACGAGCTCGPTCACGDGKASGGKPCCQGKKKK